MSAFICVFVLRFKNLHKNKFNFIFKNCCIAKNGENMGEKCDNSARQNFIADISSHRFKCTAFWNVYFNNTKKENKSNI